MTRYGAQFGPDITFLGVDPVDLADRGPDGGPRGRGRSAVSTAARPIDPAGPLLEGRGGP